MQLMFNIGLFTSQRTAAKIHSFDGVPFGMIDYLRIRA